MGKLDDLYETIGGNDIVDRAIEIFYRKVLEDENLRRFFQSTDMAHLRAGQSMFVSMLLGGQVVYTGRNINAVHEGARAQGLPIRWLNFTVDFHRASEAAKQNAGTGNRFSSTTIQVS